MDLLLGPPLKAEQWWALWVGDGGITQHLKYLAAPCGPFWLRVHTLKTFFLLPRVLQSQDLNRGPSGWEADTLPMSYWVTLRIVVQKLCLHKPVYQSQYFVVEINQLPLSWKPKNPSMTPKWIFLKKMNSCVKRTIKVILEKHPQCIFKNWSSGVIRGQTWEKRRKNENWTPNNFLALFYFKIPRICLKNNFFSTLDPAN